MPTLLASSATRAGLEAQINRFFCSSSWKVDDGLVARNATTGKAFPSPEMPFLRITLRKGRYRLEKESPDAYLSV